MMKTVPMWPVRGWVVLVDAVVVVVVTELEGGQASQQLATCPMDTVPRRGVLHKLGSRFTEHWVTPSAVVRQQVTASGLPQVERRTHL